MCRVSRIALLAVMAIVCLTTLSVCLADTNTDSKTQFDLPAEPLDKALRDFAVQAKCNISYEPSLVAGLSAPAIKGKYTAGYVLSMLLTGTQLQVVNVNEDTFQVLKKRSGTSSGSPAANGSHADDSRIVHLAYGGSEAPTPVPVPAPATNSGNSANTANSGKSRDQDDLQEITVTGSHIRGVPSASPVIEIGREDIDRSGYTSISDVMLSVPQNSAGGYNPGTSINNSSINGRYVDNPAGASTPNLRGLGPGSTLVLIDGRRMASSLSSGGTDISSIPIDAIDRVEVVTDSASSIYGSDAVAGVVNIILKKNYDGAKTSLSYGLATQGGGTLKQASQLFGTGWGSGNVMLAYQHTQQALVDASDRGFTSSAFGPFTLLPQTKSDSVTVTATQDISTAVSAFVDGLFVARNVSSFQTYDGEPATQDSPATLRKYAVAVGFNANLWNDWKGSFVANQGEDVTDNNDVFLTLPSTSPSFNERALGTLRSVELNANGPVAQLPSGPVALAAGAGYRREAFSDSFGTTGQPLSEGGGSERNIRYAFGELSIPLVERSQRVWLNYLDLTLSARDERYSDFGSKMVPKVGLVYAPIESLKLRSTWGKAFRAPNLSDLDGIQQLVYLDLNDSASPTGTAPVLARSGGNTMLKPETADAWTLGFDYADPGIHQMLLSATVFDIDYINRISQIANPYTALTDPASAFFVTRSPSLTTLQSVYDAYPSDEIFNNTDGPFDLANTSAILDSRLLNVARQTARGADLNVIYKIGSNTTGAMLFLNAAYLDLTQKDTPDSPSETLSGLAFYPAKFRARGGGTWRLNSWAVTGTINYLARETNTQVVPIQGVGSWTTMDASLRYTPMLPGMFSGLHFSLAAINVFDRDPPRLQLPTTVAGVNLDYDGSNTTPLGRFITLSAAKDW